MKNTTRIAMVLICGSVLMVQANHVDAKQVSVDPESTEITAQNNFIIPKSPSPSKIKTSVKANGKSTIKHNDTSTKISSGGDHRKLNVFMDERPSTFQKSYGATSVLLSDMQTSDTIAVDYGEIGTYKGKPVTIKAEISNIIQATDKNTTSYKSVRKELDSKEGVNANKNSGGIIIADNLYDGFWLINVAGFDIKLIVEQDGKFINFDNDTYIGFNSLNGHIWDEGQGALKEFSSGAEGVSYEKMDTNPYYVTNNTSLIERTNPLTGKGNIVSGRTDNNKLSKEFGESDFLGSDKFTMGTVSFQITGKNPKFSIVNEDSTSWVSLSSATLFNVKPDKPTKEVTENNKDINNTEVKANEKFSYILSQKVGTLGVDLLSKYSKMNFEDSLPKEVDYESAKLVGDDRKEIKDAGKLVYDEKNHKVTFECSPDFLKNVVKYEGEKYHLVIDVKVKDDVDGGTKIKNDAIVIVNKNDGKTNVVENPTQQIKPKALKKIINSKGELVDKMDVKKGDVVNFKVDFQIPNTKGLNQVKAYDDLEQEYDLIDKSVKVMQGDKDITKDGKLSFDDDKEIASWESSKPNGLKGKTISYFLSAEVKKDADLSKLENGEIGNIANLITNLETTPSNKVIVIPTPDPKPEPLPKVEGKVVKAIIDHEGNEVDILSIAKGDSVTFVGTFDFDSEKKLLSISDDFEDVLDINTKEYKLIDSEGKDITDQFKFSFDEENEKMIATPINSDELKGLKGIKLYITGTLKDIDLKNYLDSDGNIMIPNTIKVDYDGESEVSNEVNLTSPQDKPKVIPQMGADLSSHTSLIATSLVMVSIAGSVYYYKAGRKSNEDK